MKKLLTSVAILTACVLILSGCALFEKPELAFKEIADGAEYAVTSVVKSNIKELVIPAEYNGKPVTAIADDAFKECDSITSITIPNSVKSIGERAFYSCDSLTSVTIPNSVTSIGKNAFYWCESLTSIEIPNSISSIEHFMFGNCTNLASITIPVSVTSIGNYAFSGCEKLRSIHFNGTTDQWQLVTKGTSWKENVGRYTVYCTDGETL